MKKKMTVLCGLLMAVLVTAYSVSGTYAKYTSGMSTTDTARVARWSINVGDSSTKTLNLFKNIYGNNDVVGTNEALVVAPGTSGSYKLEFGGTTEVAYSLVATATITKNTVKYAGTDISPIKFRLVGDEVTDTDWFEADQLGTKLNAVIGSSRVEAGDVSISPVTIEWKWAYDKADLDKMDGITVDTDFDYDLADTKLGQSFMNLYNDAYDASINAALEAYDGANTIKDLEKMIGNGITQSAYDDIIAAAQTAGENAQKVEGAEPTITIDITITATQVKPA